MKKLIKNIKRFLFQTRKSDILKIEGESSKVYDYKKYIPQKEYIITSVSISLDNDVAYKQKYIILISYDYWD